MYCSRDHNYSSRFNQQYEKSTQYFMLYCIKIQQLNLNTVSCMIYMTFRVQFLKYFTVMEGTMWHMVRQNNFAHGTLGHAIKHG